LNKNIAVLLLAVVLLNCEPLFAKEIKAGTIGLGGDLNISYDSDTSKPSSGPKTVDKEKSVNANMLYYIMPNLGLGLGWSYDKYDSTNAGINLGVTTYSIGPAMGYNISVNEELSVKIMGSIEKLNSNARVTGLPTSKVDGTQWTAMAQLNYFPVDNISLDAGIQYHSASLSDNQATGNIKFTGYTSRVGLSVYFK
jgi:opacity protein-like surface antigen